MPHYKVFLFLFLSSVHCFTSNQKLCALDKDEGPCQGPQQERWYFNSTHCAKFLYSGCQGNANNFETQEACLGACANICRLPVQIGSCDQNLTRYYYSTTNKTCEKFNYSGCGRNENYFEDIESCWNVCQHKCTLDQVTGMCTAKLTRYYFDIEFRECRMFTYSGCGGNSNNFLTIDECQDQCRLSIDLF